MATTQENLAAENILKRAELARISRQLKSRLSKTNLKIKEASVTKQVSPTKQQHQLQQVQKKLAAQVNITPAIAKKKSAESIDLNKTEDEDEDDSPKRNSAQQIPPSSPIYEEFTIPMIPPSTPPQQKIQLNTDIYNTASTNKTQIHNSSPPQPVNALRSNVPSTPKQNTRDEGADLLMFLATSPSPVQYKNVPSTPSSRSGLKFNSSINPSSSVQRLNPGSNTINATPGTPIRNLLKTPGFNMNDYVNLFTPSPAHINSKTPDPYMSKDVNGKLIKF